MRSLTSTLAVLALLLGLSGSAGAEKFEVDSAHSSITFTVTHLQFSEVEGRFNDFTGDIDWNAKDPSKGQVNFTVQAKSVDTGNAKRDEHLRSDDFFNVAKYPTLTFKSTKIKKVSDGKVEIIGDLTMHGTTKEITVPVRVKGPRDLQGDGELSMAFQTRFEINRIDYGMGAGWKGGSDNVVSHEVFVEIKVEAHQP